LGPGVVGLGPGVIGLGPGIVGLGPGVVGLGPVIARPTLVSKDSELKEPPESGAESQPAKVPAAKAPEAAPSIRSGLARILQSWYNKCSWIFKAFWSRGRS
jgi:hypothetical protein